MLDANQQLRDAGVDERNIVDLLRHVPKDETRIYAAPELGKLKACLEKLVPQSTLRTVG